MQPATRLPHLVRGTVAAAIATFSALFAHVLGGGEVPAFAGIAVPLILSLMVCVLLSGRTLSLTRLALSVTASQALFHTLFVLGTQPGTSPVAGSAHAGHQGHMMAWAPTATGETMTLLQADALMWASHLAGAAVTVLFLYRGERALDHLRVCAGWLAAWLTHRIPRPVVVPVLPRRVKTPIADEPRPTVLDQLHSSTLIRRGPPAAIPAA